MRKETLASEEKKMNVLNFRVAGTNGNKAWERVVIWWCLLQDAVMHIQSLQYATHSGMKKIIRRLDIEIY